MIKVYLDDERATPVGWYRTFTVEQTIEKLESRQVTYLSLDNDLGIGFQEGHKVLDWLEEQVYNDMTFPIPIITIHSANATRVQYMMRAAQKIEHIRQQQIGGS
jgi:hypothetical protein